MRSDATISSAKVTLTLKNPHQRPKSSPFDDDPKRFTYPQTLARRQDEKIKQKRHEQSLLNSSKLDTT